MKPSTPDYLEVRGAENVGFAAIVGPLIEPSQTKDPKDLGRQRSKCSQGSVLNGTLACG